MRLRTYESFWLLKNGLPYTYPSLQRNISTQIAVIGGGITGALISNALLKAGYKTLLLDKRDIGTGSTAATTSMLQYEIDVPLFKLIKMIGERAAVHCYREAMGAVDELRNFISNENIDCDFAPKQSLYIAHSPGAAKWLFREYETRKKHLKAVQWLSASAISRKYSLQCFGGILSEIAGGMDAYKFCCELIRKNVQKGLAVYDQTSIEKYEWKKRHVNIYIQGGPVVQCNKVIFCTGYEATTMFDEKLAKLLTTYACISEENIAFNKNIDNLLIWNTENPYLYMRTTTDKRFLVGGMDGPFSSRSLSAKTKERKSKLLTAKLEQIVPHMQFIEDFSWGGVFGATKDGLPYIGKSTRYSNAIFVLGYGGNGIIFSVQAMKLVTDLLKGNDNELLHYYRFGR